ncbi:MAG: hypothetical protein WD341_00990 [Tistlia sp.]|uniref:hypothetical protein n=1 Tax=Tistlia sp. TaxID=3057121 RepID=UPI0034A55E72
MIMPPGVDSTLYPWGPHSVVDYVRSSVPRVSGRVVDLRPVVAGSGIVARHRPTLKRAMAVLSAESAGVCFGHALNPYIFLGLLAAGGGELPGIAARAGLLSPTGRLARLRPGADRRFAVALRALQQDYETSIAAALWPQTAGPPAQRRVIGISVYDYLLIGALHIARIIRRRDPEAIILLGGDYFDEATGTALAAAARHDPNLAVDGVVVGYGEAICRDLVAALKAGAAPGEITVPGLLSTRGAPGTARIVTPEEYGTAEPRVDYVRTDAAAAIRVLSQRGCSWGECSFCSQIDRRRYSPVDQRSLHHELDAACRAREARPSACKAPAGRISFDADENDLRVVLPLMETIAADRSAAEGTGTQVSADRYLLEFWLMVRSFRAEFLPVAGRLGSRLLSRVRLNVESLGPETLTAMRKGFSPLQALEAVKALRDAGQLVATNYFVGYPTQRPDDVAAEAALLERSLHLFAPPQTIFYAFPYAANGRDDIAAQQERFRVRIERLPKDGWAKELFGLDLPFSIWAHRYRRTGRTDRGELLARVHHRLTLAQTRRRRAEGAWLVLGGPGSVPPRGALMPYRLAEAAARLMLRGAEALAGTRAYRRRQALIDTLDALRQAAAQPDQAGPAMPDLRIAGDRLARCDPAGQRTQTPLDDAELAVLRVCYWTRTERELERALPQLSKERLGEIVARHLALGSLVCHRRALLCVAHDPAFARQGAVETAPRRLRLMPPGAVPAGDGQAGDAQAGDAARRGRAEDAVAG